VTFSRAQVAARIRERQRHAEEVDPTASASIESIGVLLNAVVREFEADPDFTLRERLPKKGSVLVTVVDHSDPPALVEVLADGEGSMGDLRRHVPEAWKTQNPSKGVVS